MNKSYDTYKDSGIEWIGKIPSHWEVIPLRRHISLSKGSKPEDLTDFANGYPYLTMDYLRGRDGKLTLYPTRTNGLELIDKNEIIVLWDGANAGEFMLSKKGYLGSTMAKINVNQERYNKDYFFLLLKSLEQASKDFANGTTIPHFDSSILNDYYYPCPPLAEQQAIAAYLDEKCGKVDSLVAELEQQVSDLGDLKKSEISRVVTKGLKPNATLKNSGIEWIGEIPVEWEVVKSKNVSSFINGYAFDSTEMLQSADVPIIRIGNIQEELDLTSSLYAVRNPQLVSYTIKNGDVLIAMSGATTGKVCYIKNDIEAYINQRVGIIRGSNKYIFYVYKESHFLEYVGLNNAGSAQPNMSSGAIMNYFMPCPPIPEQQAIADYLDAYCAKIDAAVAEIKAQIADLKRYKQSLISEAVTGKICVTE